MKDIHWHWIIGTEEDGKVARNVHPNMEDANMHVNLEDGFVHIGWTEMRQGPEPIKRGLSIPISVIAELLQGSEQD